MSKTRKTRRRQPAAASASQSAGGGATERLSDADNIKDNQAEDASDEENVTCPSCEANPKRRPSNSKDNWVECEACDIWYHWACVGRGPIDMVDKWFCADCMQKDPSRTVTFKVPQRKSARTTNKLDYANLNDGVESNPKRRLGFLATKPIKKHAFEYMKGQDVTMVWLGSDEKAMTEPIIIEHPDGLGMKMPEPGFTVRDVAKIVGSKEKVDVLDVASQQEDKGWTLESWVEYYYSPPERREKIRNVISLEISDTKLAEKISPPLLVRQIDWVEQNWPANKRKGPLYPKVQLYCLMSVAECWTDWHIDFAGSSVYYHILKGSKIFYFIRPTAANLAAYEKWSGSDMQESVWFGDLVDEVFKVELTEGNTMIIPTGWIHAVYTPVDSLVFGGNFLHSWNIATQLRVRELEMSTRVEKKARFPFFRRLCWYTAEKALKDLKAKEEVPTRVLNGLDALATFLIREVRIMERATSSDPARKDSKDQLPAVIKDPAALARELRWRVRVAAGGESGDERETPFSRAGSSINGTAPVKRTSLTPVALSTTTGKRKRPNTDEVVRDARFKGFTPRPWDAVELRPIEADQRESVAIPARPVMADGLAWMDAATATGGSVKAERMRMIDEVHRLRRTVVSDTVTVLERETVRRTYESWTFPPAEEAKVLPDPIESERRSTPGESEHQSTPIGSKEQSATLENEQQSAPIENEQQSAPIEIEQQSAPIESEQQFAPTESEQQSSPIETEQQRAPMESERQSVPIENEQRFVSIETERDSTALESGPVPIPVEKTEQSLTAIENGQQLPAEIPNETNVLPPVEQTEALGGMSIDEMLVDAGELLQPAGDDVELS